MTLLDWLTLAGLCLLGAASPGPSVLVVVGQTLQGGRTQGLLTAVAHAVGVGCYALLAALGLALVIQQTPWVYTALRWLGAAFLLFLAYRALCAPPALAAQQEVSARRGALNGFLAAFLNPKLAIFFLAVYTQFISVDTELAQKLGMAAVSALVDGLWYVLVAMTVSHPALLARLQRSAGGVQKMFGILLVLVAVRVVW